MRRADPDPLCSQRLRRKDLILWGGLNRQGGVVGPLREGGEVVVLAPRAKACTMRTASVRTAVKCPALPCPALPCTPQ